MTGLDEAIPQTLVGISFQDRFRAQEFLTAATGLAAKGSLTLRDAVLVAKDDEGRAVVHETTDLQPGRAALSGAVWAGLFGLILGGAVGWVAGLAVGADRANSEGTARARVSSGLGGGPAWGGSGLRPWRN